MQQHFYVEYKLISFIYFDEADFNAPLHKKSKFINPERQKFAQFEYFFQSVSHSLRRARRKSTVNNMLTAETGCDN